MEPMKNIPSLEKARRRLKWKKLVAKTWFYPAVYITTAAMILSFAWWYQGYQLQQNQKMMTNKPVDTLLPVEETPTFMLPVAADSQARETMNFYDEASSTKSKEASLVENANTFWPHQGIDFARADGESFNVVAAMDGKVIRVDENPLLGYEVEIQHDNGLVSVYQSLKNVTVQQGQTVAQGDVIAQAGRSNFEKASGVHLHFEIRDKSNNALNPNQFLTGAN